MHNQEGRSIYHKNIKHILMPNVYYYNGAAPIGQFQHTQELVYMLLGELNKARKQKCATKLSSYLHLGDEYR